MGQSNWIYINVREIRQETPKAFHVVLDDGSTHWLPKSQVADPDDYEYGDKDLTIGITEWIASEKGIEGA